MQGHLRRDAQPQNQMHAKTLKVTIGMISVRVISRTLWCGHLRVSYVRYLISKDQRNGRRCCLSIPLGALADKRRPGVCSGNVESTSSSTEARAHAAAPEGVPANSFFKAHRAHLCNEAVFLTLIAFAHAKHQGCQLLIQGIQVRNIAIRTVRVPMHSVSDPNIIRMDEMSRARLHNPEIVTTSVVTRDSKHLPATSSSCSTEARAHDICPCVLSGIGSHAHRLPRPQ